MIAKYNSGNKLKKNYFLPFKTSIVGINLPEKFTFPFYYKPHLLSKIAAKELQEYLLHQSDFNHNFGLNDATSSTAAIGKMFGVLVCQNSNNELGYLWAFSGKLAESNQHNYFVPPVYDMLQKNSFFKQEEEILNTINFKIAHLEQQAEYILVKNELQQVLINTENDIKKQKIKIKTLKKERDNKRKNILPLLSTEKQKELKQQLALESKNESILLKKMTKFWNYKIAKAKNNVEKYEKKIRQLKVERKQKSNLLQQKLFKEYAFLNAANTLKSIGEIFNNNPPAGAGECAAPKLLHYAFKNNLKPIAMAEFWWGQSPKSEIRKHIHFYPACRSKCEPILSHMLSATKVDNNPLITSPSDTKKITTVYEDDYLVIINKPHELLSVPGKTITDSVQKRLQKKYPTATGPLLVHRLDMSTSGLLIIAKTETIYKQIQTQFINRTIKKRYVALLEGIITKPEGEINLPLRVDLDNRPQQLVCYDYGKPAKTIYKVVAIKNKTTRVHFFPVSGRTHQLRVHASHQLGLNSPIKGDDLYGIKRDRLYLHAEEITFYHPILKKEITCFKKAPF